MEKNLVIGIILFLFVTFIFWKPTHKEYKKEYGEKLWKDWGSRAFYWQGAIMISGGITGLLLVLLRWGNIMTF